MSPRADKGDVALFHRQSCGDAHRSPYAAGETSWEHSRSGDELDKVLGKLAPSRETVRCYVRSIERMEREKSRR